MCLGIPGKIVEIEELTDPKMGVVDFGGVRREICLAYVDGFADVGDYVIVHVGFAISKVDEEEAHRTFQLLQELGRAEELDWLMELADQELKR